MTETLLDMRDLWIEFHTDNGLVKAVNGMSLSIKKGETLGLVGETGAGKTTTALGIMRLIADPPGKIVKGEIFFEGEDIMKKTSMQMQRLRGNQISMIFQDPMTSLNPVIPIGDQVAEVVRHHEKCSKLAAAAKAKEMLELVGISEKRYSDFAHQFSGGMKQRVIIAISLACEPKLLIADEPTTALDVTIQAQVLNLIRNLKDQYETSMLLITHDLGVVAETCNRVAVVYAGEIIESGMLEDIFDYPMHPYTLGLFGSIPSLYKDIRRLSPIPGLMPDPTNLSKGCKFCDRCDRALPQCQVEVPQNTQFGDMHIVRCHIYSRSR